MFDFFRLGHVKKRWEDCFGKGIGNGRNRRKFQNVSEPGPFRIVRRGVVFVGGEGDGSLRRGGIGDEMGAYFLSLLVSLSCTSAGELLRDKKDRGGRLWLCCVGCVDWTCFLF